MSSRQKADDTAHDADDGRLDELRRLAFSRTFSPEEAERAAEAQRMLAAEESRASVEPGPPAPVFTEAPDPNDPNAPYPLDIVEPSGPPVSRLTITLVAAAALVVGVIGGVVGSGIAGQGGVAEPAATAPSAGDGTVIVPGEGSLISGPGDPGAAQLWFQSPQTPADIPDVALAPSVETGTLRLAYSSERYGDAFVARATGTGDLCLMLVDPSGMTTLSCARPEDFGDAGVSIEVLDAASSRGLTLRWDGRQVLVAVDYP